MSDVTHVLLVLYWAGATVFLLTSVGRWVGGNRKGVSACVGEVLLYST